MATTTLKIWTIVGKDDDGCTETTRIEVCKNEDSFYTAQVCNGTEVDYVEFDTVDEAAETADQWAHNVRAEYHMREREYRRERREALIEAANDIDLTGDDAAAVKMLAKLIGRGRAAEALVVLRAIAK